MSTERPLSDFLCCSLQRSPRCRLSAHKWAGTGTTRTAEKGARKNILLRKSPPQGFEFGHSRGSLGLGAPGSFWGWALFRERVWALQGVLGLGTQRLQAVSGVGHCRSGVRVLWGWAGWALQANSGVQGLRGWEFPAFGAPESLRGWALQGVFRVDRTRRRVPGGETS